MELLGNLEIWKKEVDELERQLNYFQQRRLREQISGVLIQSADWDLPPDLLRRQANRELERSVLELRASGFSDENIRAYFSDPAGDFPLLVRMGVNLAEPGTLRGNLVARQAHQCKSSIVRHRQFQAGIPWS